jgi:hypothetical protein
MPVTSPSGWRALHSPGGGTSMFVLGLLSHDDRAVCAFSAHEIGIECEYYSER